MVLFSAATSSIRRVMYCSTCCAVAPGQGQAATPRRTGMSGSLRCGMELYPNQPQMSTPARSIQEMCGCSTKNLGTLRRLLMSCSFSSAICSIPLWENLDEIAVLQSGGSNNDDLFPWLHTVDTHITPVSFTERDLAQMRHPLAALFSGDKNCIVSRGSRVSNNGAKRHGRNRGFLNACQTE